MMHDGLSAIVSRQSIVCRFVRLCRAGEELTFSVRTHEAIGILFVRANRTIAGTEELLRIT